jgi:ATP-dependent Clp protease protease subunit
MMDNETWLSAKMAKREGFADGMLYEDSEEMNYSPINFNRLVVQNNAAQSVKKLMEIKEPEEPPETDNTVQLAKAKMNLATKL